MANILEQHDSKKALLRNKYKLRDLSYVTHLGARTRRHRYFTDTGKFGLAVAVAIILQSVVYFAFFTRTSRSDWENIVLTLAVLALVPIFSAATLSAFRRHHSPIMAALAVTLVFFSFAVSALSAMRIPVSYLGLSVAAPVAAAVMAIASVRFNSLIQGKIAMLANNASDSFLDQLKLNVDTVENAETNLNHYDLVLIDPAEHHSEKWSPLLSQCYLSGVEIMPWNNFAEIYLGRTHVKSFDISHISYSPGQLVYARLKRFIDLAIVAITLPVTLPLAFIVACYIYMRDGGPVLFVQHRKGFGGKAFRIYKFRTMYKGTASGATRKGDNRIIRGCGLIRRFRLDELPQLFNIVIGDMSLIGPRPEALDLTKWYEKEIPEYGYRLLVLPGLSGWAQVRSGYTSNPREAEVKLSHDLYYVKHLSFDLDLQILFRTIRTIVFGSGAR